MPESKGWSALRRVEAIPHMPPWATGRFYGCPFGTALTTGGGSSTTMGWSPIYVPNPDGVTVTSIGVEVTAGGTSSSARFGIYGTTADGRPGNLILDSGLVSTTSTGFASASVSQFLRQGWYYLSLVHIGSVRPTTRRWNTGILPQSPHGYLGPDWVNTTSAIGYQSGNDANWINGIATYGLPPVFPDWSNAGLQAATLERIMVGI